jgi:hypothetical protein
MQGGSRCMRARFMFAARWDGLCIQTDRAGDTFCIYTTANSQCHIGVAKAFRLDTLLPNLAGGFIYS